MLINDALRLTQYTVTIFRFAASRFRLKDAALHEVTTVGHRQAIHAAVRPDNQQAVTRGEPGA
ncbi:MAG TPA: hypothetical protein VGM83_17455 [Devosiaceae bacterium]